MERIKYRITLDTHKTGIQRTLQGFETADKLSRSIAINLTASGDTYELPLDNVVAMMYVTTPGASEPSINECFIKDNTITYDVLPIVEEGITEMQLKLIETSVDGAKKVLIAPRFAVEVTESGTDDESAEQSTTFTALENAIAKAQGVYDARLLRIEIDKDCTFRAVYADGTVYENDALHEALYNGNALLSESWAKGGTGMREGEDVNNSMYFSNVSKSSALDAKTQANVGRELVDMVKLYSTYTAFSTNFETGELEYISASHTFDIDEETGDLLVEGDIFTPDEIIGDSVDEFLEEKTAEINEHIANKSNPHGVTPAQIGAATSDHTHTASDVGLDNVTNVSPDDMVVNFERASVLQNLFSGQTLSALMSTLSKAVNSYMAHTINENPHGLTAEDVGASPTDHTHTASEVGAAAAGDLANYLPLSGGSLSGNIFINKKSSPQAVLYNIGTGRRSCLMADSTGAAAISTFVDNDNATYLKIRPETNSKNTILQLLHYVSGAYTTYNVFHTGNVTCGTTELTSGTSALGTDCIYQMYE